MKSFEYLYNKGIDCYNKNDFDSAINFFKLAIEKPHPKPQVYYNLGLSYHHIQAYELAVVAYKKFLEFNSKDHDGLYNLALTYFTSCKFDKAVEFFRKCFEIKKDEDTARALTLAYLAQNDEQSALKFADEVFEIPERGIKLLYVVAKVFENKNVSTKEFVFLDIALSLYSKILEKENHFESCLATSICYAKKGEWANSVVFCQKAIEINPKSYDANNQMGLVFYCSDKVEEAVKYYENALKLKPVGDYKVYSNLAYAYEKVGEVDKAIKIFTQLVSKFDNYPAKEEIKNHLRVLKNSKK